MKIEIICLFMQLCHILKGLKILSSFFNSWNMFENYLNFSDYFINQGYKNFANLFLHFCI